MRKLLLAAILVVAPSWAEAQSIPSWKSYQQTGNPADIVPSAGTTNSVATWMGKKVDVTGGTSTGQTLTSPIISGGNSTGTDVSAAVTTAGGGSLPRTLASRQSDHVNAADYLSAGQSVADFTTGAIDAEPAISAALATGKSVQLPCGYYLLNESIPAMTKFGQSLSGVSQSCVTLAVNFTSGDVIKYVSAYQSIHDIEFYVVKQMTSGSVIHAYHAGVSQIYNINIQGGVYNGIVVDGSNGTRITDVVMQPPFLPGISAPNPQNGAAYAGNAGIVITGDTSSSAPSVDTFINNTNISQYKFGIYADYASGIYSGSGVDLVGSLHGVILTPSSSETVNGVQLANFLSDTSYGDNWYFTGAGLINEVMCTNCWASSSISGSGLYADNSNSFSGQVTFTGSTFLNNYGQGINLDGMRNWNFSNNVIEMNSRKASGYAPDIGIYAGTGNYIRIQNSFIGAGGRILALGAEPYATYAIDAGAYGAKNYLIISGNQTSSHITGSIKEPESAINTLSVNNQGD